jgi:hypothetical protein
LIGTACRVAALIVFGAAATGCAVGPDYQPPVAEVPA